MNTNTVRLGIAAAAVVLAGVVGVAFLGPNIGGDPEPSATPAVVRELPTVDQPLSAGTYSLGAAYPVGITFDVPAGWESAMGGTLERGASNGIVGISFLIVDNVVTDPCAPGAPLLDPPVGPSVEELVTAISDLEGFEATAAIDVTIDGFHGKQFTLTAPDFAEDCEGRTWATATRVNGVAPREISLMQILDAGTVRVVIIGTYFQASVSEEQLSALQQVIASTQIEP